MKGREVNRIWNEAAVGDAFAPLTPRQFAAIEYFASAIEAAVVKREEITAAMAIKQAEIDARRERKAAEIAAYERGYAAREAEEAATPTFLGLHRTPSGNLLAVWSDGSVALRMDATDHLPGEWRAVERISHAAIFGGQSTPDLASLTSHPGSRDD